MDERMSNCSTSASHDSKFTVIDLQLFLIETLLILVVLSVTVAKRLCFNNNNDNDIESDDNATNSHVLSAA